MKKLFIILIIIISIIFFLILVYQGLRYSRGVPVAIEEAELPILEVPFIDKNIDFGKGIDIVFWEGRPSKKIDLFYQLMAIPWPKKRVPYIEAKAFHNKKDIYFYLEWPDNTEDRIMGIKKFSDAGAVMFPLGKETQSSTLMMGFLGKANIWQWKASQDSQYWLKKKIESGAYVDFYYPFEEEELFSISKEKFNSAANDLVAIRVGTITTKLIQNIQGRGIYDDGVWRIVLRRAIEVVDDQIDAQFPVGKRLCAFAVWNGSKGDRGGRKSISDWVELIIK